MESKRVRAVVYMSAVLAPYLSAVLAILALLLWERHQESKRTKRARHLWDQVDRLYESGLGTQDGTWVPRSRLSTQSPVTPIVPPHRMK